MPTESSLVKNAMTSTSAEGIQTELLVGAGATLWTKNSNNIPVCWFTPGYAREKGIIINAVARSWERVAPVHFEWKEGCPTTGTDLYVKVQIGKHTAIGTDPNGNPVYDHSTDGQTRGRGMASLSLPSFSPSGPFDGPGMTIWVEDNNGSTQQRMEYVAIHEFGHVLGFAHEQDRSEAEALSCRNSLTNGNGGPGEPGDTPIGPYDPDSVMNYCNAAGNNYGILTEGDIAGVRDLYGHPPGKGTFFADLNGDGRADAIAVNRDANYVMLSDGSKLTSWGRWSDAFFGSRDTLFADVNRDGRADAIAINNKAVFVMTSDGTKFTNWAQWTSAPFFGTRKTVAADVNGDGRADLIAINNGGVFVMTSNGTAFTNWAQWAPGPYYGTRGTFVVDVNGDGLADLVAVRPDGIYVALSDGTKFVDQGRWSGRFFGDLDTTFADVNGDGKADAIAVSAGQLYVSLSDGKSFGDAIPWTTSPFFGSITTLFADLRGGHTADAIAVNYKGNFVMTSNGASFLWSGQWSPPFYGGF